MCLPSGLDCYRDYVVQSETNCTLLPCKGIYADVTIGDVEDLYMSSNFRHVLAEYTKYKSGFDKDQGRHIFHISCFQQCALVFKKDTHLHMIRVRFGGFSLLKITKGLKANWVDKLSHFGGTAGLFSGVSYITFLKFWNL